VTFGDALNMATGIGDLAPQREPNQPFVEIDKPKHHQFFKAQTAKEKLDVAFSYGKYPGGPGEVLRYNNSDTFVLAAAMDSFLKRQVGLNAQPWDMMLAEVFRPIGIFHLPTMHTQEADGGAAFRTCRKASIPRSTTSRNSPRCCSMVASIRASNC
jgi:CubicO group peptidase (beta-lactamase class C family)